MSTKPRLPTATVDALLKALLVATRSVAIVLETRAVKTALGKPLSSSKVQILRLLNQRGGQTSTQVARYLGVTKPAVSQIVESMVREKYLARQVSKADRRERKLILTTLGRKAFVAIRKEQRHYMRSSLRDANPKDPDKLIDIMLSVAKSLAQADKDFEQFCLQCESHGTGSCVLVGGSGSCEYLSGQRNRRKSRRANQA